MWKRAHCANLKSMIAIEYAKQIEHRKKKMSITSHDLFTNVTRVPLFVIKRKSNNKQHVGTVSSWYLLEKTPQQINTYLLTNVTV